MAIVRRNATGLAFGPFHFSERAQWKVERRRPVLSCAAEATGSLQGVEAHWPDLEVEKVPEVLEQMKEVICYLLNV